jgi:FKBP-type peptidyl-prolyl cis-trans isomerase (trigger factor)
MAILATKEETATRTTLEIEVPAEDVERAFAAVTKSYVQRAAIPGFRKGKAPVSVIQKRFSDEIKGDVLEAILPTRSRPRSRSASSPSSAVRTSTSSSGTRPDQSASRRGWT